MFFVFMLSTFQETELAAEQSLIKTLTLIGDRKQKFVLGRRHTFI